MACGGPDPTCQGKVGCACSQESPCDKGLRCEEDTCTKTEDEQPADNGSESFDEERKGQDGGEYSDEKTEKPRCEAGSLACRCRATGLCNTGLRCDNDICQQCPKGSAGCACQSGNKCQSGLRCENQVCKGCAGKAFCPCHGNNSCDTGNVCELASDGSSACKPCKDRENKTGCNCEQDSQCGDDLLCINQRCLSPKALKEIPKEPKCYSPCEGDQKESDGSVRSCHPRHKLMSGCLTGQVCDQGSCIDAKLSGKTLPQDAYPFCQKDADCPSWQACISGRCYSNCQGNSTCGDGFRCHSYVCRRRCTLQKKTCDSSKDKGKCQTCSSTQVCQQLGSAKEDGLCLPLTSRKQTAQPQTKKEAVVVLNVRHLDFTHRQTSDQLVLVNQSAFTTTFSLTRQSDTLKSQKPLSWLTVDQCKTYSKDGATCTTWQNQPSKAEPLKLNLKGKSRIILRLAEAHKAPSTPKSYQGVLQIQTPHARQVVGVSYRGSNTGRWRGKMYSLGHFADDNIDKIRTSASIRTFPNALVRRWLQFKRNEINLTQFQAILRSIQEQTWNLKNIKALCKKTFSKVGSDDIVCYPFASSQGVEVLSISHKEAPIPGGVSALNFVMDVEDKASDRWEGRVVTSETLQYPGDPKISITFDGAAGSKSRTSLSSLLVYSDLGGRYQVTKQTGCTNTQTFGKQTLPWLLTDFIGSSTPGSSQLTRERYECRQNNIPLQPPAGASSKERAAIIAKNQSISGANPLPSGRVLRRTIELVDGLLLNNETLIALVRERLTSPFASSGSNSPLGKDVLRYGYIWMTRSHHIEASELKTKGNAQNICKSNGDCGSSEVCEKGVCQGTPKTKQVSCSPELVQKAMKKSILQSKDLERWSSQQLEDLSDTLLLGQTKAHLSQLQAVKKQIHTTNGLPYYAYQDSTTKKTHYIHYLCVDTGQFNGGPANNQKDCPIGSQVIYFAVAGIDELAMRKDACQAKASCEKRYQQLKGLSGFRANVPYKCAASNAIACDGSNNPKDLRADKVFFPVTPKGKYVSPFAPLRDEIAQAFRYRFKFQTRAGKGLGFAPVPCSEISKASTPYCYDAKAIESVQKRVNCIEYLFTNNTINNKLSTQGRGQIRSFLVWAFGYSNAKSSTGAITTQLGFETLNAELRVMLGDADYVKALSNRYDLAGSSLIAFEGAKIEPNGLNASGVLGSELYHLYRSVHYYQSVLDRFYAQTSTFSASFRSTSTSFLTANTVTSYIPKLLLAATRKARSWSQIARKYHSLNRLDLAQHVMERSYVATYIEQTILTQLLNTLARTTNKSLLAQLRKEIDRVALTYSAALSDMQETYQQVSRKVNQFGFAPGYIPFPAIDSFSALRNSQNAFSVAMRLAKQKLTAAQQKENLALQSKRSFDTSAAQFQSELVKIETNYNEQLISLCGALKDGERQVPAIPRYASVLPKAVATGNPCGKVKGSAIYEAYLTLEKVSLQAIQLEKQKKDLFARMDNEVKRIQKTCASRFKLADITWDYKNEKKNLQFTRSDAEFIQKRIMRAATSAISLAMGWKCEQLYGGAFNTGHNTCYNGVSNTLKIAAFATQEAVTLALELDLRSAKREMLERQRDFARVKLRTPCDLCDPKEKNCNKPGYARVASQLYLTQLAMKLHGLKLQALQADYNIRLAAANIQALKHRAQRMLQEQSDALNMLTEVQAAANDPNQRIYKNDAILSAERTFHEALREAYRATLIYEYYTSQSYKRKNDLYLVRMVSKGSLNLERYLEQLEQAFREFEESSGKPDLRVAVISLRDDIIKIPRLDKSNQPIRETLRTQAFQQALVDPKNFNKDGYLRFPFSINVGPQSRFVSPVTFNHKVAFIEAEIQGTEVGNDGVGRIYIQQKGTGVVRDSDGSSRFYALPQRTAVINPYFNGVKIFTPSTYRNFRLQDRPLGNTQWEFLFNQVTEKSNQDIQLSSVSDIILYVYYKDFTRN